MTTELANYQGNGVAAFPAAGRSMRLIEWADEARAAHALAEALCKTPFAGAYRGDPDGATAAILKGAEVGLTPVTALGAFDLIQGTPAPKALTLRALVQSHGHSVWIEESTPARCVAKARRRGESVEHSSVWTAARAQKMGLTSKTNWKNQPEAMLMARATSEVCRMVAADVILGIGYSYEELADLVPEPTTTTRRADPAPTTTARRKPPPPVAAEPDLEPPPAVNMITGEVKDAEPKPKGDDLIDPRGKQMRKLQVCFTEAGIDNPDTRHQYAVNLLGRPIESTSDLSVTEAARLIDALESDARSSFAEPPLEETS